MPCSEYGCPLNGCKNKTGDPRKPCGDCLTLFGDLIQPSSAQVSVDDFLAESEAGAAAVQRVLIERWVSEEERAILRAVAEARTLKATMPRRTSTVRRPGRPPRLTVEELAGEAVHLLWCGVSREQAAKQLGVSKPALEAAIQQARETAA